MISHPAEEPELYHTSAPLLLRFTPLDVIACESLLRIPEA